MKQHVELCNLLPHTMLELTIIFLAKVSIFMPVQVCTGAKSEAQSKLASRKATILHIYIKIIVS